MKCGWSCGAELAARQMHTSPYARGGRQAPSTGTNNRGAGRLSADATQAANAVRLALRDSGERRRRLFSPDSSSPRTRLRLTGPRGGLNSSALEPNFRMRRVYRPMF
jgi:hypothetical protein